MFVFYILKSDLIAKLELVIESENIKNHLKSQVFKMSKELQGKFEHLQQARNKDCDETQRMIVYDLGNINPVYCGLGCQLHGISAAFLCASENNRQFSIINYPRNQYENYFDAFNITCPKESNRTMTSENI